MWRWAVVVLPLVFLSGCDSPKKRAAIFMPKCEAAQFTHEQCAFLFALAEQAKSDADDASTLGAVAVGMAAGARGGK